MIFNRIKKYFYIFFILLVITVLTFSHYKGKEQDEVFLADYDLYQNATTLMQNEEFYKAIVYYQKLLNKEEYQKSISIYWGIALAYKYSSNHTESAKYFESLKSHYPGIVSNQLFLEEYGEVLSIIGDDRAQKYLERVKKKK